MTPAVFAAAALLALIDAGFAGFRDAAGRDGRVFKDELYRAAIRRGVRAGAFVMALASAWMASWVLGAGLRLEALAEAFALPAAIALGYAALMLSALAAWALGEADVRSLASLAVLGPFTLARPAVIVLMAAAGLARAPDLRTGVVLALPCLVQLGVGPWLGRRWSRRG